MDFKSKYTTAELVSKETAAIALDPKLIPVEKSKSVLTNDAYAIGQLLETLINKGMR